jgi:hypothetical protein
MRASWRGFRADGPLSNAIQVWAPGAVDMSKREIHVRGCAALTQEYSGWLLVSRGLGDRCRTLDLVDRKLDAFTGDGALEDDAAGHDRPRRQTAHHELASAKPRVIAESKLIHLAAEPVLSDR